MATKKAALDYCQNHIFKNAKPLFEIVDDRQIHTLLLPCGTRAEASLDQVVMVRGKKKFSMREIELEFKSGHLKKFKAFVRQLSPLSLIPSSSSKYEVALQHLAGDSRSKVTLQEMANLIVKKNREKLKKLGARQKLDADAIHDMRVATRRLRAALKTFRRVLPEKAKKIQTELQKLSLRLGKKRDLDLFSAAVKAKSKLVREIDKSQKQIVSLLQSKGFLRLIGSLEQLKTVAAQNNILKVAAKEIRKALRRVLEIAPSIDSKADDKTLHKLRISAKKLRYTCEFFASLFSFDAFIEKTEAIQDILGEHQDAITGISMLVDFKGYFSKAEFLKIKQHFERQKTKTRSAFSKIWKEYCLEIGFRKQLPLNAIGLILEDKDENQFKRFPGIYREKRSNSTSGRRL